MNFDDYHSGIFLIMIGTLLLIYGCLKLAHG